MAAPRASVEDPAKEAIILDQSRLSKLFDVAPQI
jgi:hypothetical protein